MDIEELKVNTFWGVSTKYRYNVLTGDPRHRCRDLLVKICDSGNVRIPKGVVSKDHHMHVEYPPSLGISNLVKKLKGRSSRLLQKEFPALGKKYWGVIFGLSAMVHEVLER